MEKPKSSIPMFGKAQIVNSNVWKRANPQFQSLEKTGTSVPMIGKAQNPKFYCLEKPTSTNSNAWKRLDSQFQCLEKHKS